MNLPTRRLYVIPATLVASLALVASPVFAVSWDGEGDGSDYNDPINWTTDMLPSAELEDPMDPMSNPTMAIIGDLSFNGQAIVNLDEDPTVPLQNDLRIGNGIFGDGVFNHSGGAINTGDGPWSFIGADGDELDPAVGVYNLSGTASFTQVNAQYHIGLGGGPRIPAMDSSNQNQGTLNISDSAVFNGDSVFVGSNDGNEGTVNQTGGELNANSWISIGREGEAEGFYNMSGGSLNVTVDGITVGEGGGAEGTFNVSGSSTISTNQLRVGRGFTANGDGFGVMTITGDSATINATSLSVGSDDGTLTDGVGTIAFDNAGSAGGEFSPILVSGDVTLNDGTDTVLGGSAALSVADTVALPSSEILLVDVGGTLTGTFAGLPEGSTVAGRILSYLGGDGNDIVLTADGVTIPGDTDCDGDVDLIDLDTLGANFGVTGASGGKIDR